MTWTLEERRRRREKLKDWLAPPDESGEGAGRLYRKSYREIAVALSQEFKRPISQWSARDYVRNLWKPEERKVRLHQGGRPATSSGRTADNPEDCPTAKMASHAPDQPDILVGVFRDLMQLCDISAAELYRSLKNCPDLKELVGSKSSLHKRLARDGEHQRRQVFPLPRPRDHRALALSLHQLVVLGPECLRVILLASELRTRYINAQIFEVHLPWQEFQEHLRRFQPAIKRMGTPALKFNHDWQASVSLAPPGDSCPVCATLPREVIEDFVVDTCQRLPDRVHVIFFNKRLHYDGGFTPEEECKPGKVRLIEAPTSGQQFLPIQSAQSLTTERLTALVTSALNTHNRINVYPLWDQYWSGIDRWQAYVPASPMRVRGMWSRNE